jgi:hypothetical protein
MCKYGPKTGFLLRQKMNIAVTFSGYQINPKIKLKSLAGRWRQRF